MNKNSLTCDKHLFFKELISTCSGFIKKDKNPQDIDMS